ncbi:MAG: 16S rRNA (guanine(527)-N(7))-methyltransferase RsmG [Solirubrobacterales bacterium]
MSTPVRPDPDPALIIRLKPMLEMLATDPASLSSVVDPHSGVEVHLLDSLSGTVLEELENADSVVDIGSGAGFPGIPLAAARPATKFDLIDSIGRKVDFMERAISTLGLDNVKAMKTRSEEWAAAEGRDAYSVATARAVAPLSVLAELASPLLCEGGSLVAWKGARELEDELALGAVEAELAMSLDRVVTVRPFPASRDRHLYVIRKTGPTPERLPRRPGMARKRPFAG